MNVAYGLCNRGFVYYKHKRAKKLSSKQTSCVVHRKCEHFIAVWYVDGNSLIVVHHHKKNLMIATISPRNIFTKPYVHFLDNNSLESSWFAISKEYSDSFDFQVTHYTWPELLQLSVLIFLYSQG